VYSQAIMVADANLRHAHRVFWFGPFRGYPSDPSWSPDGTHLAFADTRALGNPNSANLSGDGVSSAIFVVNVDGTGLRRITPWSLNASAPDWSPDGSQILFQSARAVDEYFVTRRLDTIRPDGTDLQQLTHFRRHLDVDGAAYSPDGASIVLAILTVFYGESGPPAPNYLYTINPDGTNLQPITRTGGSWRGRDPSWGPANS
jgi:TolB protein